MKGDSNFRETTNSSLQSSNEVYIYKNVISTFKNFVKESNSQINTDWVPRVYFADYKKFPELSDDMETVLALENLKPSGYRLGPRIDLDETHLKLMITTIASYHAVSYAMKIKDNERLMKLKNGLRKFTYIDEDGKEMESYKVAFTVGLERFFRVAEEDPKYSKISGFMDSVNRFKVKYFHQPSILMQNLITHDDVYSIILHGDYNRNNVLFQYPKPEGYDSPTSLRTFDFQEVRFSTPVVDLAFFMYMNTPAGLRERIWDELLQLYHQTLFTSILDLLKCSADDPRLLPYNFENFLEHFKSKAFYGVMIGIHFIPWMACPEEECQLLSHYFETDLYHPELRRITQICGGKDVDDRILGISYHAYEKGYWKIFD
jgi:hypothetical protein